MDKISVTFKLDGKEYSGTLDHVAGAGNSVWHLMVDEFYWGRLRLSNGQWFFDESILGVGNQIDHFAATVIAWYQ
jgi:hypothetical protein